MSDRPTVEQLLINVQTNLLLTPREWLAQHGRTLAAAIAREYPAETEPSDDRLVDLLLERSDDTRDLIGAVLERLTPEALAQAVPDNPAALALVIDRAADKALYGSLARRGHLLLDVLDGRSAGEQPKPQPLAHLLERCRAIVDEASQDWINGETGELRWLLDRAVTATEIAHLQHDLDVAIRATKETP